MTAPTFNTFPAPPAIETDSFDQLPIFGINMLIGFDPIKNEFLFQQMPEEVVSEQIEIFENNINESNNILIFLEKGGTNGDNYYYYQNVPNDEQQFNLKQSLTISTVLQTNELKRIFINATEDLTPPIAEQLVYDFKFCRNQNATISGSY
tara:strand:- start:448 stop:897 length:450 start_codon:yes stop_codon:yes gene_type:complete